jgi:hypothetical protein
MSTGITYRRGDVRWLLPLAACTPDAYAPLIAGERN